MMRNCALFIALGFTLNLFSQGEDPKLFQHLQWRMVGPFRGGRTVGASGDALHPNVFFVGVNNGGVWKSDDYGTTWKPVFDDQPTGSVGDVGVAPSNPNVIYVGSGEGLQRPDLSTGNGIYKSIDGGKIWKNMGLQDAQQIGNLAVDSRNENRVFVAALGHPYGPNAERGIFRTLDGGNSWEKVLYVDENTGAIQVTIDPSDPNIVFADLWSARQAPWENGYLSGSGSGLYKSVDGGKVWKRLSNGLPNIKQGLTRIGFAIAPSDHLRMYALVAANKSSGGFFMSNDGGESWKRINTDLRLWDRGDDFAELKVDPLNKDIVYDANVVLWKSTDAGKTWTGFRGAPGGDDYHRLWINPLHPEIMLVASDQGAIVTVNGGSSWSSWYNQPTAQLYHVNADNDFPYHLYGGQQESGSVGISSRGNDGAITFRDWHPVGIEEYGYAVPDPLNSNIIYGGKISRYDKTNGQVKNISPALGLPGKYRFLRTAPILFSPINKKMLLFAGNVVFKTYNEGRNWMVISPDLTRKTYDIPECIGIYRSDSLKTMKQRGVVYSIAASALDSNIIWAGTDDGLIHHTSSGGKEWINCTPPILRSWSKVSVLEAGHFDAQTCYAAINNFRLDQQKPCILRTRDGGKSWTEITSGLPAGPINVIREDPKMKGLLFAGSENAVFVSFDDGDYWQSLRLNMPATSIRDLFIKDDDIAVATHGRSFWILDNISALRQLNRKADIENFALYLPQPAVRVRWNLNTDTPLPPDEPVGENPPDGAMMDYCFKANVSSEVTLDIFDETRKKIRHYSSWDTIPEVPYVNIPLYWVRDRQKLTGKLGSHRFLWDMHVEPLHIPPTYPISAIEYDTPPELTSPWVMEGVYTLKLSAEGKTASQLLTVKMDPRVRAGSDDLRKQFELSMRIYEALQELVKEKAYLKNILQQLDELKDKFKGKTRAKLLGMHHWIETLLGIEVSEAGNSFKKMERTMLGLLRILQECDCAPEKQEVDASNLAVSEFSVLQETLVRLKMEVIGLNIDLKSKNGGQYIIRL